MIRKIHKLIAYLVYTYVCTSLTEEELKIRIVVEDMNIDGYEYNILQRWPLKWLPFSLWEVVFEVKKGQGISTFHFCRNLPSKDELHMILLKTKAGEYFITMVYGINEED